ncbi:helix-turn-helix domain-containing protein [Streptomyces dubilierae]|uniref:Helix-turn-helix transcriptional regulator n=1 Tax=Streptomyces dubilierae TaxID=3075533 RepID=A0ABU2PN16_9ACTN|nr:helix-turn-helix transcriptional regulator [Streptomyces sp. DSM 41921]MDT0392160.1 helix-turn-helix transcriptional regulator [Streptomyces sp. DSM 41921]
MSESTAAEEFAALLGELKERSGLSYGVLAKRLHMSTSTLHRYCNGDAVPADYAPVERLARLCKASPRELVELHRRWVLADAERGRKGGAGAGASDSLADEGTEGPGAGGPASGGPESGSAEAGGPERGGPESGSGEVGGPGEGAGDGAVADKGLAGEEAGGEGRAGKPVEVVPAGAGAAVGRRARRPRPAVLAGVALAVVLGGVGLAVAVPSGGTDGDGRRGPAAASDRDARPDGSAAASVPPSGRTSSPSGRDEEEGKGKDKGKRAAASSVPSASATGTDRPGRDAAPAAGPAPLTVDTEPHAWESPCSQRYLVNLPPGRVVPPPLEQDAPGWVAAMDAVPSGQQLLKVTVQGTGDETVVLKGLTVRMAGKRAPLAWNDYAMGYPGVGCGGGVPTRFFTVALDAARPAVVPEAGHDDFPFKVSESDPEVYYIQADASAYDVSWYLELRWSSGSRQGTLTVDDRGRPFRTSGNNGRPAYEFPLGGQKWVEAGTTGTS